MFFGIWIVAQLAWLPLLLPFMLTVFHLPRLHT